MESEIRKCTEFHNAHTAFVSLYEYEALPAGSATGQKYQLVCGAINARVCTQCTHIEKAIV